MSDDDIIERGGTQEDINNYAHDVGGACGAVYDGTCDHPGCKFTPTPYTIKVREVLINYRKADFTPNPFIADLGEWDKQYQINKKAGLNQALQQLERLVLNEIVEKFYIYQNPDGSYQYDPSFNQILDEQRAIITNGKE